MYMHIVVSKRMSAIMACDAMRCRACDAMSCCCPPFSQSRNISMGLRE